MVWFGPAGNSSLFYEQGYKDSTQMPKWLSEIGLSAYEYSCARGVRLSPEKAKKIRHEAEKYNIKISVHSPYYINLSTSDEEKRFKSIKYITDTAGIANILGAKRIVVHSGACSKISREAAMEYAKITLSAALKKLSEMGLSHIHLCPETMGKLNQLGTLDEVLQLCTLDDSLIPTIDFGHLYARNLGNFSKKDAELVFEKIENVLGIDKLKIFHSHFSKIEYSNGGEKRHTTFEDMRFGPEFEDVAEIVCRKNLSPTFICESAGCMAEDALKMKQIYKSMKKVT